MLALTAGLQGVAFARDPSAASAAASQASTGSVAEAGSVLVGGSIVALGLAGSAVVTSVEAVGEGSVVVLQGLSDATTASIRVVGGVSVAVGSVVEVVALSTGCVLINAGRMIAFVPNEVGRALVHQRPLASLR